MSGDDSSIRGYHFFDESSESSSDTYQEYDIEYSESHSDEYENDLNVDDLFIESSDEEEYDNENNENVEHENNIMENQDGNADDDELWRIPDESGEPPGNLRIQEIAENRDAASRSGDMPQDFVEENDIDSLIQRTMVNRRSSSRRRRRKAMKDDSNFSFRSEMVQRVRSRSPHGHETRSNKSSSRP